MLVIGMRGFTISTSKIPFFYEPLECDRQNTMNRKKKVNEILNKRLKKSNAKLHSSNKPRYISKAERAKMELEAAQQAPEHGVAATEEQATADVVAEESDAKE
ncbi:DUF2986 domain-containing protein [Photobacterium sagamiensis]|uniref:DUF2986 domain-containing protein n=1 Tax=Photobacterium sagamiensis TaxID=2910241 RepID=UPI003D0E3B1A